jgi:cellulose synthase/poly-beta-1,6-N-acetylglucosamine synthase-like glycosyltransferase
MAGADGGVSNFAPIDEDTIVVAAHDDWRGVAAQRPDLSAQTVLTRNQIIGVFAMASVALAAALIAPNALYQTIHWFLVLAFTGVIFLKQVSLSFYWAYRSPLQRVRARIGPLPVYTVLCPLYREAESAPTLAAHLQRLDYPQDRLDIIFILEADDYETRAALERLSLPTNFRIFIAPEDGPRTKPKAMNAALHHARGEFVAVYDAEDAPHPGQIKAALSMFAASSRLGCVQAPLVIDNYRASWIAGQFALEYALQFRVLLPAMMAMGLPAPLGGTSNHFRSMRCVRLARGIPTMSRKTPILGCACTD